MAKEQATGVSRGESNVRRRHTAGRAEPATDTYRPCGEEGGDTSHQAGQGAWPAGRRVSVLSVGALPTPLSLVSDPVSGNVRGLAPPPVPH